MMCGSSTFRYDIKQLFYILITSPEKDTFDLFSITKNPSGTIPIVPLRTANVTSIVQDELTGMTLFHQSGLYHIGKIQM